MASKRDFVFAQTEAAFRALADAWTHSGSPSLAIFIDPTLADPFGEQLSTNGPFVRHPLAALKGRFPQRRCPYLVEVPDAERSWLPISRSVEQAVRESLDIADDALHPRSVCGWIVDPGDCRAFARRLGTAAMVVRPEREFWPLRYWDPRVIGHLPRVLSPEQYAALRPCLGNWWSIDGEGELALAAAKSETTGTLPLRFEAAQWRRLERIEGVNEVMRVAAGWGLSPSQDAARRIEEAMERAVRHGFTADEDQRTFAVCALIAHPRFDEHPRVDEGIAKARAEQQSFADAIESFDDNFWASLSDGRWLHALQQGITR